MVELFDIVVDGWRWGTDIQSGLRSFALAGLTAMLLVLDLEERTTPPLANYINFGIRNRIRRETFLLCNMNLSLDNSTSKILKKNVPSVHETICKTPSSINCQINSQSSFINFLYWNPRLPGHAEMRSGHPTIRIVYVIARFRNSAQGKLASSMLRPVMRPKTSHHQGKKRKDHLKAYHTGF